MGNENSGKPQGEIIRLDGMVEKNGVLKKTNFFKFLGEDLGDYSKIVLTDKQAIQFKNHVTRMKYGVAAAIPRLCSGQACSNKLCFFHEDKNYPVALPCLLETRLIQTLIEDYVKDLDVDPESVTEMVLINKLVECDLIDYRINLGLAGGRDEEAVSLLRTNIMEGDRASSETMVVHPLLDAKEKFQRIRAQILESLAATRREKYKRAAALKEKEGTDASTFLSDLQKLFGNKPGAVKDATSFAKMKEEAEKLADIPNIVDADWSTDG